MPAHRLAGGHADAHAHFAVGRRPGQACAPDCQRAAHGGGSGDEAEHHAVAQVAHFPAVVRKQCVPHVRVMASAESQGGGVALRRGDGLEMGDLCDENDAQAGIRSAVRQPRGAILQRGAGAQERVDDHRRDFNDLLRHEAVRPGVHFFAGFPARPLDHTGDRAPVVVVPVAEIPHVVALLDGEVRQVRVLDLLRCRFRWEVVDVHVQGHGDYPALAIVVGQCFVRLHRSGAPEGLVRYGGGGRSGMQFWRRPETGGGGAAECRIHRICLARWERSGCS